MTILTEKDEKILQDYLNAYKECFEAQNDLLNEIIPKIELTDREKELAMIADMKYKNMLYHIRKWLPNFRKFAK